MSRQGIEQGRATTAYDYAKNIKDICFDKQKNEDGKEAKNYKSYVKKIPMMIKTNGLGATLAFVKSKRKSDKDKQNAYAFIYDQLTEWISVECNLTRTYFNGKSSDLVKDVIAMNSFQYRAVTIETLALLAWLRRFAEGLIQGEAEGDEL